MLIMKYQEILPPPALRPFVENYWLITIDGAGSGRKEERSVPDGNTSLMFISEQVSRIGPDGKEAAALSEQAFVVGQKSKPVGYQFDNSRCLQAFGIRFRPAGLSYFTSIPQCELKDTILEAGQAFRHLVEETQEQIVLASDGVSKAELANRFLWGNLLPKETLRDQAERGALLLLQCKGETKIRSVSEQMGLHPRRLERLFNQYIGMSPKAFARVVRFNAAVHCHSKYPRRRLTELAHTAGYFDQMQLIKDFKAFTKQTPKAYFRQTGQNFHRYLARLLQQRFDMAIA